MLYIFLGPNEYDKELALNRLRQSHADKQVVTLESEGGLAVWQQYLEQADLFGQQWMVVGRDQLDILNKADLEGLVELLQRVDALKSETPVVLLSQTMTLPQGKGIRAYLQQATIEKFATKKEGELLLWLKKASHHLGIEIATSELPKLCQRLGYNQQALATQLYAWRDGGTSRVDKNTVAAVLPLQSEMSAFGLTEAWAKKNLLVALEQLETLWQQDISAQQIIGLLAWQVEVLRVLLLLKKDGMSEQTAPLEHFEGAKLNRQQRLTGGWKLEEINQASLWLLELDYKIKTSKVQPRVGLEIYIVKSLGKSPAFGAGLIDS